MFAIRLASASTGISYPYLYLNSAASDCARWASGLASAMAPVMTQPTDCEIWKMCETDEGSMSLSCGLSESVSQSLGVGCRRTGTFFWDRTTAQSLPLSPMDMMLAAVMALKAYSAMA